MVLFRVSKASSTWPRIKKAGSLCVNVLLTHQQALSSKFSVTSHRGCRGRGCGSRSRLKSAAVPPRPLRSIRLKGHPAMRVLAVVGSPEPGGKSAAAAASVLAGARGQGADTELAELAGRDDNDEVQ